MIKNNLKQIKKDYPSSDLKITTELRGGKAGFRLYTYIHINSKWVRDVDVYNERVKYL